MEGAPSVAWEEFLKTDYATDFVEIERLSEIEDPETEPFKSKDAATKVIEALKVKVEPYLKESSCTNKEDVEDKLAMINFRTGALYIETEQAGLGEPLVSLAVNHCKTAPKRNRILHQEALNSLGVLWCNRNDHDKAQTFLEESEEVYEDSADDKLGESDKDKMEAQYTLTLFYLAQVFGHLGDAQKSADYCSLTLNRQLEANSYDKATWAQNAAQLAGFYVRKQDWTSAGRCLSAAYIVFHHRPLPHGAPGVPESSGNDDDVAANVELGLAKLYAEQLKIGRNDSLAGECADTPSSSSASSSLFPAVSTDNIASIDFSRLGYIPVAFEGAREVFNLAMQRYRVALQYYVLDGFVTEHIDILIDLSQLYKHVSHFESDSHRQCVMHRKRAKPLEPILETLNPKAFEALWKQIHYELGDSYRAIMEIKKDNRRPFKKMEAVGQKAIKYYSGYIRAVEESHSARTDSGRINGTEESAWLTARFCRARTYNNIQHQPAPGEEVDVSPMKAALGEFESLLAYSNQHNLQSEGIFGPEHDLCQEMTELLPLKISSINAKAHSQSQPLARSNSGAELIESANEAMEAAESAIAYSTGTGATAESVAALSQLAEA